ncbi:MAG TPA: hypothetical protein VGH74_12740 [Planctomycetaceae bacterium]
MMKTGEKDSNLRGDLTPATFAKPEGAAIPPLSKGGQGGAGHDVMRLSWRQHRTTCDDRLARTAPSQRHATPPNPPVVRGGINARLRLGLTIALCLIFACESPVFAAPESDGDADQTTEKQAKPDPDPKSVDVDDEPVKSVLETLAETDKEIDRLERAIEGMRSAQKRISAADTSGDTQKIQNQVVKDLQDLLAMLKKQQSRKRGQSQNQKRDQDQQQSERQKMQKDQTDPQNSGSKKKPEKSGDPRDGRRNQGKSADSQERTDAARVIEEKARRAQMIKDVWGHLPPHVREAMLNSVSEKYLPKYEELVKKYYEALAEQNRKRKQANDASSSRPF